ncbi:HlyD family efflux transporter periplasmic adaptor subunit [Paraburkholderia sp. 1N]|uniref:HlyD family efflux transporter periplasmic adaptor subunit n=1 Tax=Paraburkholderia solitsugae TaxID=2675748 RepID=A0ABX2BRB1_9BURK|nr:HlyD family secretion protein [Paraburkholderia solitsugae]NPT42087.1 HlyD family efflux transporter periplasmic adaptor subunit [Paraburkholderia solitsugae]
MPQRPTLFRSEAQNAQGSRVVGEILLIRPLSFKFLTAIEACMAACIILLFVFGSYTRRTSVEGVITPDGGLVKVYAQQAGVVLKLNAAEGQSVNAGESLYTISTDLQSTAGDTQAALIQEARQRKESLLQEIDKTHVLQADERETLQDKITSLRAELSRVESQLVSQRTRTSIAADAASRYENLLAKDYISKDQAQQHQADLLDQQSKLESLERDRTGMMQSLHEANSSLAESSLQHQNQIAQIQREVIAVDQTVIESEAKREFVISAPEAGTVTAVIAQPGQTVDIAQPLVSIVPEGTHWRAYLFVPSAAIGFVRVGDPVLLRYQAFPYQKFGQYQASVVSIARTALSAAELATSGIQSASDRTYYRITVALKSQTVTAYGKPQALEAGMTLQADILQERRRLYEWVLEPLYSMTGKL